MAYRARAYYFLPLIIVTGFVGYFVMRGGAESVGLDLSTALQEENVVPVVIVGSGPSGLSSALYVARAGMKAFLFAGPTPCGQLTQTSYIENWPGREKVLGIDLMYDIKAQAESFGACIINDSVTAIDFDSWPFAVKTEEGREFKALTVIFATGARPKTLSIPGEREFWGKGVTTCAVCDAPFFKNKDVVVVGGGDSAAEEVFELAPYVRKVTMLVRKDFMRAAKTMQKRILAYDNVAVEYNKDLKAVYGKNGEVTSIDIYDNKEDETENRPMDGVFLAIGHNPNTQVCKDGLLMDDNGYLKMKGRSQQTSVPGVFAAGEVQDPTYRQAVVAAGEGVKAALDATSFLYGIGFNTKIGKALDDNFFETFSDERLDLQDITELKEFEKYVINQKGVVVLDFYSYTCPGCIKMLPSLESLAHRLSDKVTVVKCNISNSYDILYEFKFNLGLRVKSVPAIFIFKDGKFLARSNDLMSRKELFSFVSQHID